jgi:SAM-dependent methyltransferase
MPVVPNTLERLAFLRLNRGPGPFLDLLSTGIFHAVTAAIGLRVFETLRTGPLEPDALAARVDAGPAVLKSLCELLVGGGYLDRTGEGYRNTAMTRRWLTDAEGTNMAPWLTAWDEVVLPFWERELDTVLGEGAPSVDIYTWAAETGRADTLHAGFRATARLASEDALSVVGVPDGAARLLDVGGGHGRYAAAFAAANPELTGAVVDLKHARETFTETVAEEGVADRVAFRAGDYLTDDLGSEYDLALVFNVLHAHDPETNAELFGRVFDALAPGGRIAVLEEFTGEGPSPIARTATRFVDFTYRVTLGARTYPSADVEGWLRDAGFENVRTGRTRTGVGFVLGERPWRGLAHANANWMFPDVVRSSTRR